MKIAINVRHGGFGLSDKACQWLIDNKGWTVTDYKDGDYANPDADFVSTKNAEFSFREKYHLVQSESSKSFRNNPDLIEVIETLGAEANGNFADLEIVEIPDDVDWQIEEYDGVEWIAEVHIRWW
jgi:hypothetical protein